VEGPLVSSLTHSANQFPIAYRDAGRFEPTFFEGFFLDSKPEA
jgi:hypothetical protein